MAVTKKFQALVAKVIGSDVGELLRQVGEEATRQCYTAQSGEYAQYALDTLPDAWRDPLATWLRARGVVVTQKAVGSSRYFVGKADDAGVVKLIKSPKGQEKALADAKTEPVLRVEAQTVRVERKTPELKGLAQERANDAAKRMLAKLRKIDPDAAALLNDKLATPHTEFDQLQPTDAEVQAAIEVVTLMRMESGKLRMAA